MTGRQGGQPPIKPTSASTVSATVPGYRVLETLGEGHTARVYKVSPQDDPDQELTLKVFRNIYPTPSQIVRFQQEFQIIQQLESPYLLKHFAFKEEGGLYMIVREFAPYITLREWLAAHEAIPERWLNLALNLAQALADIHRQGVMHGDIKPSNILIDPETLDLKVIDFGISRIIEGDTAYLPVAIEGTLAYISPEQTGRMNREIDYRSDFYALGVMLFEMATGQLPFVADNHLELVHAHLAHKAPPVETLNPAWPPGLSRIIVKLMAKNADERYQTAVGLLEDLKTAQNNWLAGGQIPTFELGVADELSRFHLPQKLYGRDVEINQLQTVFQQALTDRAQLLLVTGVSGIGKSALIRELDISIIAQKGYFVSGKYEQYQRNLPYSALLQSLRALMRQLLLEPAAVLNVWRETLQAAVAPHGQVIVEVIPEAGILLGQQPPVADLLPEQAQRRFNLTFSNFIRACCATDHPLVLFLDDLQWADPNSFLFLEMLLADPDLKHLPIFGAYRDNEVDHDHPLSALLRRLKEQNIPVHQLHLGPLQKPHLIEMLSDTLHKEAETVVELAELLLQKTEGNPFFVNKFLEALYQADLLYFAAGIHWSWDITRLRQANLTDNVVELLVQKLADLPENSLDVLKYAACIGSEFNLPTLSLVTGDSLESIYAQLLPVIQQEFIAGQEDTLRFLHDRVREAVYTLLSETEQRDYHWRIGQAMLQNLDKTALEEALLSVANHLNRRLETIIELGAETEQAALLLDLNYRAGLKARESLAFEQSKSYLEFSCQLFPPDIWERNYRQAFKVAYALTQAHFVLGDFDQAISTCEALLERAATRLDKATCYLDLARMWYAHFNPARSIQVLNEGLILFEQGIPEDAAAIEQLIEQEMTGLIEQPRSLEAILALPEASDPEALIQLSLLGQLQVTGYTTDRLRYAVATLKTTRLSFELGLSPSSSRAFVGMATLLIQRDQIELALLFKAACQAMIARYRTAFDTAWTVNALIWLLTPIIEDLNTWRQLADEAALVCQTVGDVYFLGAAVNTRLFAERIQGTNLPQTLAAIDEALNTVYKKFENKLQHALLLEARNSWLLPLLEPQAEVAVIEVERVIINLHNRVNLGMSHYYLGKYELALTYFQQAEAYLTGDRLGVIVWEWRAFYALTLLANCHNLAPNNPRRAEYLNRAAQLAGPLTKILAQSRFFAPHEAFIQAELAYARGDEIWFTRFHQAIERAAAQNYILLQARINEAFAQHLINQGQRYARGHIEEAFYLYEMCGAANKITRLQQEFTHYLSQTSRQAWGLSESSSSTTSGTIVSQRLDLRAILKASRAISSEIDLERALNAIMQTIGEVSGAESATLIMEQEGEQFIQARYQTQTGETVLGPDQIIPLRNSNLVSESIVRYVHRTRQMVLLDDAYQIGDFVNTAYIQSHKVRSVLCQPIQEQNRLVGIIYLENNFSPATFTPERVEVVRLLAGQAAISIENANLYTTLEASEKKYRALFEDSNDCIFISTAAGQIIDMNPAGLALFGYSRADLEQLTSYDFYANPDDRLRFQQEIAKRGSVKDFEVKLRKKNGLIIEAMMTATVRQADDETILGYQGLIRDITAQKWAEQERLRLSAIERELGVAQEIQQSLLPAPRPGWPDLDVICYNVPARNVGGDFYSYQAFSPAQPVAGAEMEPAGPAKYVLAIGDVSGKGVSAALLMATSLSQFDASLAFDMTATERLVYLDRMIMPYTRPRRQNCALCYVEILLPPVATTTDQAGLLRIINAGCIPPYIKRTGGQVDWFEIGGFALGLGLGAELGYQEVSLNLTRGDLVILTSDGVVEANNAAGQMFSFERLEQAIANGPTTSAKAMLEHLQAEVTTFTAGAELHDDLTIVVAQV